MPISPLVVRDKKCLEVSPEPINIDPVIDVTTNCLVVDAEKVPI